MNTILYSATFLYLPYIALLLPKQTAKNLSCVELTKPAYRIATLLYNAIIL